jgi:NADH-quinone oxidoreductase subunit N
VLVILAVIGSLIGVYYYFRIVIAMFLGEEKTETKTIAIDPVVKAVLIMSSLATLVFGLAPDLIVSLL